jgi:hypothetical protein
MPLSNAAIVPRLCPDRFVPNPLQLIIWHYVRRGADKSLAFPIFLCAVQLKEIFLDRLKKLEQRNHKCVELKGEYIK